MFWNATKIISTLATIKADTANHKETLQIIKENFEKHVAKEEMMAVKNSKKMEDMQATLLTLKCPYEEEIKTTERRLRDVQEQNEGRRLTDIAEAIKERVRYNEERAIKDKKFAEDIASLKSSRKYNFLGLSGVYVLIGVIIKKVFS